MKVFVKTGIVSRSVRGPVLHDTVSRSRDQSMKVIELEARSSIPIDGSSLEEVSRVKGDTSES